MEVESQSPSLPNSAVEYGWAAEYWAKAAIGPGGAWCESITRPKFGHRRLEGAPVDASAPEGPWNWAFGLVDHPRAQWSSLVADGPAAFGHAEESMAAKATNPLLARDLRGAQWGDPPGHLRGVPPYQLAGEAIRRGDVWGAWIELAAKGCVSPTRVEEGDHPLWAALGRKQRAGQSKRRESSASEVEAWAALAMMFGARPEEWLGPGPSSPEMSHHGHWTVEEAALAMGPDSSRAWASARGLGLRQVMGKLEKQHLIVEMQSLAQWALGTGDRALAVAVGDASASSPDWTAGSFGDAMTLVKEACAEEIELGNFVPLMSAKEFLSESGFDAQAAFAQGALSWMHRERFALVGAGKSPENLAAKLRSLASAAKAAQIEEGTIERAFVEANFASGASGEETAAGYPADWSFQFILDKGRIAAAMGQMASRLGNASHDGFEAKTMLACGFALDEIKALIPRWDASGQAVLDALEMEAAVSASLNPPPPRRKGL